MKKILLLLAFLILLNGCGNKMTTATIETNMGTMEFKLFEDKTPITVENFKKLANENFYDGTRFHRVIKDFMVQGGDPLSKDLTKKDLWGTGGPGYNIKDEFHIELRHDKKGILSMANAGPDSGGSQFFITLVETPWLDNHHSVFGMLTSGKEVLDKLGNVDTDSGDKPFDDIIVKKITIS
jgi:cyclophilin family peptidyl-prolyl cis-trans isomerase